MKILRSLKKHTKTLLVLSSIAMISFNSYAKQTPVSEIISNISIVNGVTTVSVGIPSNNECSAQGAYFDDIANADTTTSGFSNCRISVEDSSGELHYLANVIAKFGTNENVDLSDGYQEYAESTQYENDVDENMWTFKNETDANKKGTWSYDNAYPDIRFWIAKAGGGQNGSGFRLFWTIENNDAGYCKQGTVDDDGIEHNLNFECMNLAQSVTTGDWTTPVNKGLSHITFFGGLCTVNCDDGPVTTVSEPTTFVIFALGLLGLAVRRKQSIKARKIKYI
jgi:hypothetical protein